MGRSNKLTNFLEGLTKDSSDLEGVDFSDINATNREGENALHMAVWRDEYEVAEELVRLGINIDARGDLGNTPLHVAASTGKMPLVRLLVENGADLFALNEGYPPFTAARFSKHNDICDYLAIKMKDRQSIEDAVYVNAKIAYLEHEIERLKKLL